MGCKDQYKQSYGAVVDKSEPLPGKDPAPGRCTTVAQISPLTKSYKFGKGIYKKGGGS